MTWDEIADRASAVGVPPELFFREELQKCVLACLSAQEFFTKAVLQGGTALRLFYGNPRFSEDLDFVLRAPDHPTTLEAHANTIGAFVRTAFPFVHETRITTQKQTPALERVILRVRGPHPAQNLRLNLELAAVPSYSNLPKTLAYQPLNPTVRVESLPEILADKATAIIFRPYLKGRDVWDLHYLIEERGLSIDWSTVARKANDYGHSAAKLRALTAAAAEKLAREGTSALAYEMSRFLSPAALRQYADTFPAMAEAAARSFQQPEPSRGRELEL
ncbi:MAG: nucleotidyl transferase AbiEii/AbiGii toxin family protein [Bacillota bacterium]|nr:nucleotidyl transferase AbiEii/AbiGii toxin family protein [Bacillota bacterium]